MLSEKNLEELQCAVSNQQHFLINPITLNKCGHSICKRCIPKKEITLVKCKICDIASFQDFKNTEISTTSQQAIKTCINGLFDILEKETAMKLNDLKGKISKILINELKSTTFKIQKKKNRNS